jgi:prefoldin subunit 5
MTERLKTLEAEFQKGQQMLAELDQRRAEIRDTLLRIGGAIQVLKELASTQPEPAEALAVA